MDGNAGMSGCLRFFAALVVLIAVGIYCATPRPTRDRTTLRAIAAESQHLLATGPIGEPVVLPKGKWPPAIASLRPYSVIVRPGMVDITITEYFDGGWGYGFAPDKRNLTMLPECWTELGDGIFWHDPC
jgi:hypothetical protein